MSGIVVIGSGVGGLAAASYLARAGHAVTVLESEAVFGGYCANAVPVGDLAVPKGPHLFSALDPQMLEDFAITLQYTARDLALIGLRDSGPALVLPREAHEARASLAALSIRDAERYAKFRRELFTFARSMRALWWEEGEPAAEARALLRQAQVTATTTWLDGSFETDALRAALAFDALAGGLAPQDAGSALLFTWRAAQEMSGLQGAVSLPAGGAGELADALVNTARASGVVLRANAKVERLISDGERVRGVVLAGGEEMDARAVLSSLSRRQTLLDFLPRGTAGFALTQALEKPDPVGEAKLVIGLKSLPPQLAQEGRYVIAERLEAVAAAHSEAALGRLPADLALEAVIQPTEADPPYLLSVLVRPVPVEPEGGWQKTSTALVQAVLKMLEAQVPRFLSYVGALAFVPPKKRDPFSIAAMVAPWRTRIETPLHGLYLCGEAGEPVPCLSGRAGRIAAAIVIQALQEAS